MPDPARQITQMLRQWSAGDASAADELTPLVYSELRRLAAGYLRSERQGHTLQPTGLIHEAYLRLVEQRQPEWRSRTQFFRFSAHLMRQILVDHARARNSVKRGVGFQRVTLTGIDIAAPDRTVDLLVLDQALDRLAAFDQRRANILELRYFGGLSDQETAESLNISVATVRRALRLAESWLARELSGTKAECSQADIPPE
jgi:RNA polymerase sigma-70 factor, ECF subfamily